MKFITISFKKSPEIEPQERILIENFSDLEEYFKKVRAAKIAGAFQGVIESKDDFKYTGQNTLQDALTIEHRHSGVDLISSAQNLNFKLADSMFKALFKDMKIIVNYAGGWCPFNESEHEEVSCREETYPPQEFITTKVLNL